MAEAADHMTVEDGYRAMFEFLETWWRRGGQSEDWLASMLSSMQFSDALGPTKTIDPAQWFDWLNAVDKVQQ